MHVALCTSLHTTASATMTLSPDMQRALREFFWRTSHIFSWSLEIQIDFIFEFGQEMGQGGWEIVCWCFSLGLLHQSLLQVWSEDWQQHRHFLLILKAIYQFVSFALFIFFSKKIHHAFLYFLGTFFGEGLIMIGWLCQAATSFFCIFLLSTKWYVMQY